MSNVNKSITLNDLCHEITVGYVGPMAKEYIEKGVPLLRSLNIKPYILNLNDLKYISSEFHSKISKSKLHKGDVVIIRTGKPGTACVIEDKFKELNCSDLVIARPNSDVLNPYYLSFYFNSMAKTYVDNQLVGAIQQHFNVGSAKKMIINLPDIHYQKKVVNVLNNINQKIELNNRINSELEALAKTIYDYWFVQFDFPNVKGQPYRSSGGEMVWNEELKREIPFDWEVEKIGNTLTTALGGTPSTKEKKYWIKDGIPWLNSGEIANFPIITSELSITSEAIEKSATKLLPKGSTVLSITRHLRPSILAIDACANQSVIGIYESKEIKSSYIYPYLQNEIPRLMSLRTGAQQPHINKNTVDTSNIIVPPSNYLLKYYKVVDVMYQKINTIAFESQQLTALRDWLLPLLMNGQVRVK